MVAWFDAYTFLMGMPGWAQPVVPGWSLRDLAPLDVAPDLPPARRRRVVAKAVAKAKAVVRAPPLVLALPLPSTDTRPMITRGWRVDNVEEFARLLLAYTTTCPICIRTPVRCVGPIHGTVHDMPTRCTHMVCCPCWEAIAVRDRKCPFCRDDVSEWLTVHLPRMHADIRARQGDVV
jgi:hypothetical protein